MKNPQFGQPPEKQILGRSHCVGRCEATKRTPQTDYSSTCFSRWFRESCRFLLFGAQLNNHRSDFLDFWAMRCLGGLDKHPCKNFALKVQIDPHMSEKVVELRMSTQFQHQNALFHACESDFHFDGQFSNMAMHKKPQAFDHCKKREKSSLVVETSEKVLCVDIRMSTMSTMLFSMLVRVSFMITSCLKSSKFLLDGLSN